MEKIVSFLSIFLSSINKIDSCLWSGLKLTLKKVSDIGKIFTNNLFSSFKTLKIQKSTQSIQFNQVVFQQGVSSPKIFKN